MSRVDDIMDEIELIVMSIRERGYHGPLKIAPASPSLRCIVPCMAGYCICGRDVTFVDNGHIWAVVAEDVFNRAINEFSGIGSILNEWLNEVEKRNERFETT